MSVSIYCTLAGLVMSATLLEDLGYFSVIFQRFLVKTTDILGISIDFPKIID